MSALYCLLSVCGFFVVLRDLFVPFVVDSSGAGKARRNMAAMLQKMLKNVARHPAGDPKTAVGQVAARKKHLTRELSFWLLASGF
ncbi:MAG TPA: hypothetical protein VH370_13135 [Humisphaera sp.]|jgi:hypothetical protein|nr:hypothetical protein [Humisphaera sp.]